MFTCRTLLPNVQLVLPLVNMDRQHLTRNDLDFSREELPTVLIVDLRDTRCMDSEGLAWLVNLQILMDQQNKTMMLLGPSAGVANLLKKVGIENNYLTVPSLEVIQETLGPIHPELFGTRIICSN